ncbi:dihydrolipoyl dehydrogenase [Ferroplasma sp.]|uniref:dihydrolipoyl dehydrogenase n=1 Tax=Ferroplasma sp. TaxID=2591003 RepID=UPI00307F3C19
MESYDVITIGAGGACYPAAFRLKKSGFSVLMVDDKGIMSGNCLSEGCVPSKAIIETVHNYKRMKDFASFELKYSDVIKRKDKVQKIRYEHHEKELMDAGLEILKGTAKILDDKAVEVKTEKGNLTLNYKHLIIGSGAYTFIPKIKGIEYAINSANLFKIDPEVKKIPESIAIIGGGYIGVETASYMSLMGSRVELLERSNRILMDMDSSIVEKLTALLPEMRIHLNNEVIAIEKYGNRYKTIVKDNDGNTDNVITDMVMIATGREPNFPEGLKEAGIEFDRHGIHVNSGMQTNIKNIYATGDVNGIAPLFHAARRQSLVAAYNIMAGDTVIDRFSKKAVPFTLYSVPNMSFAGITPEIAGKENIKYTSVTYKMSDDTLAEVYNEMDGEITLLFDEDSVLIGGYIIGNDAGNIINEICMGISKGLTARDFAELAHQHPMTFEGLDTAARKLF